MKEFKGYKCDFCGKKYEVRHACERHENACKKNPENDRACFKCKLLDKIDAYIYPELCSWDSDSGPQSVKVLFCNKLKYHMVPPEREKIGKWYTPTYDIDNNEIREIMMPKICEFQDNGCMSFDEIFEYGRYIEY